MVITFNSNGKDYYYKLTKRALRKWEKRGEGRDKNKLANLNSDDDMDLFLVGLEEGHRLEGKKFKMSLDELFDLDAKEDLVDKFTEAIISYNAKKQTD